MFIKLFSLLILLTTTNALYKYLEQDHIINLGDVTWDKAMKEFPNGILVYFYEPYCLSCRTFWPEFQKAAKMLSQAHSSVQFAKVECHDEYKLCDAKKIENMPTISVYKSETEKFDYIGALSAEALKNWVTVAFDAKLPVVDLDTLFKQHSVAILTKQDNYLASKACRELEYPVEIAKAGSGLADKFGQGYEVVVLTQGFQVAQVDPTDVAGIIKKHVKKIYETDKSAVPTFSQTDYNSLKNDTKEQAFVLLFRTNSFDIVNPEIDAFDKTAKLLGKANLQFRYVNIENDIYGETMGKQFGVTLQSPITVGIYNEKKMKFLMNTKEKITEASLQSFIEKFNNNTLKRYYMSASVPKQSPTNFIKELVGSTYHDTTENQELNVFVMFYFPSCKECMKIEAAWESLAYRYRRCKNLVIARIDVSENDVRGFDVKEVPVLVFYPAGDGGEEGKSFVQYTAERNIKNFRSFLLSKIPDLEIDMIDL